MGEEFRPEKRCPDKCKDGCCLWCRWDSCKGYWVCYSRPCREKFYDNGNGYGPEREKEEEDGYGEKYQSRKPAKEPEKEEYGGNDWGYGKEPCREKDPCREKKDPCHKKEKDPCGKEPCWDPCCEEKHDKPDHDNCFCEEEYDKDYWRKEKRHDDPCCC
jgi:hypothetical protein